MSVQNLCEPICLLAGVNQVPCWGMVIHHFLTMVGVCLALWSRLSHFIFCQRIQTAFAKKNGMSQTMQEPCITWNILKFFRCWLHGFHHNSRKVNLQLQNLRKKDRVPLTFLYHYILKMGYFTFLHLLGGYQPHQSPNSCSVGSTWAVTSYKVVPRSLEFV